jgi:hypothetical protein
VPFKTGQVAHHHPTAQLESGSVGQVPVKNGQVVAARSEFLFGVTRTKGDINRISLSAEASRYRIGKVALVFHYENAHFQNANAKVISKA